MRSYESPLIIAVLFLHFFYCPVLANTVIHDLKVHDPELDVTLWAESPLLYNPTNMDVDAAGRIWVTEGVNYRRSSTRKEGDRVVVLEDTNLDGIADKSTVFIQDPELVAPMGIGVIDNVIYVSQTPHIIKYIDVNRNLVFDKGDKKEIFLTGFTGSNHDHSTHSVIGGPDGKLYFNQGNCGAKITDRDGRTFYIGSFYYNKGGPQVGWNLNPTTFAGKRSDDGHVWVSGFTGRINPDGTGMEIVGHGYRNSYEQIFTSFGDMFQNDNDDPPACRTSFVPEGAFFGFCSEDGKFGWSADRIAGQTTAEAEWRTHLPGSFPPGDVYGSGSPTGITYYENGSLPKRYEGSLFSCEPAKRQIFRYVPKPDGAGYKLEREVFISRQGKDRLCSAFSDILVGTDGLLYIADWYDPVVGGHGAADRKHIGKIYRIAPKGFKSSKQVPKTAEEMLVSPAHNVRFHGFQKLKSQGQSAFSQIKKLLNSKSPWLASRAIWVLPHLGKEGHAELEKVVSTMGASDFRYRTAALRSALRYDRENLGIHLIQKLRRDESSHVRRVSLTHLRDFAYERKKDVLLDLITVGSLEDRTYLESVGLAADGSEDELWSDYCKLREISSPKDWDRQAHLLAWRLHGDTMIEDLVERMLMDDLSDKHRMELVGSLAMNRSKHAFEGMKKVFMESKNEGVKDLAKQFLVKGMVHRWKEHPVRDFLVAQKIIDAKPQPLVQVPGVKKDEGVLKVSNVLNLKGDIKRGKISAARCYSCHQFDQVGVEFGPNLKGWGQGRSIEEIARAIIHPSAGIAHGYESQEVTLEPNWKERKNFWRINGIITSESDPLTIRSAGGLVQKIPSHEIHYIQPVRNSLMLSAHQLGMSVQDVADIVAYLKTY
ncbi:c-type cytochrome [Opitutales bacterium]|nr:c-type cytochrome [Opitutales bacterium]